MRANESNELHSPMKPWYRGAADHVELALYVQPGAKKTEWAGEYDGSLKLRLAAPPVEGEAPGAPVFLKPPRR
ncbi:DUF167 domain-containing protein [Crenobacter cavernae]|nr:DUF167 domain-containing protein [Crenobacter cavernae]